MTGEGAPTIASVRWRPFTLPLHSQFEAASGALDDRECVVVEIRDESGQTGIGEASPFPGFEAGTRDDVLHLLDQFGGAMVGLSGLAVLDVLPADGDGVAALRCAIDTALLDLEGKRAGVAVAALLDESPAQSVLVNAVLGQGEPEDVARYAREATEAGYSVLKLKVGVGSLEHDFALVSAVREACPDAVVRLDANAAWDEETAAGALDQFTNLRVELLEQPVAADEVEALARLRDRSPFRLAADESLTRGETAEQVLALHAADVMVLKPMLLGGIRPALALARRAAQAGIGSFVTTTFDSSIGTAAALQLAAALPWDAAQGLGTGDHLASDVVTEPLRPEGGHLRVRGPGLGIELDEPALDALASDDWHEA